MSDEKLREICVLEKTLKYLIKPDMTVDEKLKALADSFWRSHNSGYCDRIAGMQMSGVENSETERHDLDCKYKYEVDRLYDLLKEYKEGGSL